MSRESEYFSIPSNNPMHSNFVKQGYFNNNFCIRLAMRCLYTSSWWLHQMETFSAILVLCAGNSPATSKFPSKRPVTRSFDFFFICAWTNGSVNNRVAGDLRRHRAHYDVTVMCYKICKQFLWFVWLGYDLVFCAFMYDHMFTVASLATRQVYNKPASFQKEAMRTQVAL